jgi:hypothetical protein
LNNLPRLLTTITAAKIGIPRAPLLKLLKSLKFRKPGGVLSKKNEPPSPNMMAARRGLGPRRWRGSIRPTRRATCRRNGGCSSSTTTDASSTKAGPFVPHGWDGSRSTFSAATAPNPSPASTAPACSGCSMAESSSLSRPTRRPSPRPAGAFFPSGGECVSSAACWRGSYHPRQICNEPPCRH